MLTIVYRIYFITINRYNKTVKKCNVLTQVNKIYFIQGVIYIFEYGIIAHYV